MPQSPTLISKANYLLFTAAWQQLSPGVSLNSYFQAPAAGPLQPVFGIQFPIASIKALLSTVGITKIKARFCIENGRFNIVLFGSDTESLLSAYYLGTPVTVPPQGNGTDGNIPQWLAQEWINNWKNYVTTPDAVITASKLFSTRYGLLKGYTYEIKDFMEAMYKRASTGTGNEPTYAFLHFTLHNYYREDVTDSNHRVDTFDLVLQRARSVNGTMTTNDEEDPYYDITAPCPPICGDPTDE